ncbi:MAG: MinD/ParA family protein [Pyrinomonadaceae bacterium]|nr:MinD/ParA family protein [Pyrinomonadaceae bacterium]
MTHQVETLQRMAILSPPNSKSFAVASSRVESSGAGKSHKASHARTIAVTSGKGGVGKSNFAVNVSLELAALGRRVSLLDGDLALANADVLLGLHPQYHLGHVLAGLRTLDEVVVRVGSGVRLIPGGSGFEELANLSHNQHTRLIAELCAMENDSDFLIIDTAAGIGHNVMDVLRAAAEVVIVTTPDPTAVVDAYATIKVLHNHSPSKPISIVVNDVVGIGDADHIFSQLRSAVSRFLNHEIYHLGTVPRDAELAEAVREQRPVVEYAPDSPSARAFRLIAKHLHTACRVGPPASGSSTPFWRLLTEADV